MVRVIVFTTEEAGRLRDPGGNAGARSMTINRVSLRFLSTELGLQTDSIVIK